MKYVLLGFLVFSVSGCSFHVGFDYEGKTEVDNRRTTQSVINKGKY